MTQALDPPSDTKKTLITHKVTTRFFVTLFESISYVLHARSTDLSRLKRVWKITVGCVLALQLFVAYADGEDVFHEGVGQFKAGAFEAAVRSFEQARQQGLDSPVLHYNLASAYYKLGQYDPARRHFSRAAEAPELAPLSHYNLGLVAVRLDEDDRAVLWFKRSYQHSDDPQLKQLAAAALETLGAPPVVSSATTPWSGWLSAGLGYDDNVTRVNDDISTVSNQDDTYLDLYASMDYQLNGNRRQGNVLRFGGALSRYSDLEFYNQTLINAGLYHYHPLGRWRTRLGGHYYYEWLNGESYQQRFNAQARADWPYRARLRLRFQYDYTQLDELDDRYAHVAGQRQRLKIEHTRRGKHTRFKLGYRLELNDREDLTSGTSFISYSPTRHTLYAGLKQRFSSRWYGRLDMEYRNSRYGDDEVIGGVNLGRREDDRARATLRAAYRFTPSFEWEAMYRRTRNDSNFDDEDYTANQVVLSLNRSF